MLFLINNLALYIVYGVAVWHGIGGEMADLFDYLSWRGDLSEENCRFNEVDYMILSRFSYLPFEYVIKQNDMSGAAAEDLCKRMREVPDINNKMLFKDDARLINAIITAPRFGGLRVFGYVNQIDNESQTQFSAITIEIAKDKYYICFRGTDNTLVGWKEDFNMAIIYPVPAQELALRYLEDMALKISGEIIVGGHSKGGNIAVYSSACASEKIQKRISGVYNFDGPGFNNDFLQSAGFGRIYSRLYTYVPQSSVIGMLFGHDESYIIVESSQYGGLLQHDTYSWKIERNKFIQLETLDRSCRVIDHAVKEWIDNMDLAQRKQFVETVFMILSETNAQTFKEIGENWLASAGSMLKSMKNLDDNTRKAVLGTFRALVKSTINAINRK